MKKLLWIILFIPFSVYSAVVVEQVGEVIKITYDEPTLNEDGTPLTDLDHIEVYYDLGAGPVLGATVPASSPTGGANVSTEVTVPVSLGQEYDVPFTASAFDTSGNKGEPSDPVVHRIDKLSPAKM